MFKRSTITCKLFLSSLLNQQQHFSDGYSEKKNAVPLLTRTFVLSLLPTSYRFVLVTSPESILVDLELDEPNIIGAMGTMVTGIAIMITGG